MQTARGQRIGVYVEVWDYMMEERILRRIFYGHMPGYSTTLVSNLNESVCG